MAGSGEESFFDCEGGCAEIGYEDVMACQLEIIGERCIEQLRCVHDSDDC